MELIPQKLRRAHEDCEVIFFCGAGVSMPAGLPSFGELVENVLSDLLPAANQCKAGSVEALAWKALENYKYDEAIEILESADQGGYERRSVRARVHFHLTKQKTKLLESHVILARLADLDTDRSNQIAECCSKFPQSVSSSGFGHYGAAASTRSSAPSRSAKIVLASSLDLAWVTPFGVTI